MSQENLPRKFAAASPRVESGPVQFGEDWPGVFIRGDNAAYFAMTLKSIIRENSGNLNQFSALTLSSLQSLLAGAVVGPAAAIVASDSNTVFDGLPEGGQFFRHIDGGLYLKKEVAQSSEDRAAMVVYKHLWPFEQGIWVRPEAEFKERFFPVSVQEVRHTMKGDREQAQAAVTSAKQARRSNVRVTVGVAKYAAPEEKPTADYPSSSDSKI